MNGDDILERDPVAVVPTGVPRRAEPTSAPLDHVDANAAPLVTVRGLTIQHRTEHGTLDAVRAVDLTIGVAQTVALIGESGCGKTSFGKGIAGLNVASSGEIRFRGAELSSLSRREWQPYRRAIQMVFQDSLSSLDPRKRVGHAVVSPLKRHFPLRGRALAQRVDELMRQVGLDPALLDRFPHELSGGQRQRLNIARALAPSPALIVCDEPVSALDVSLQAQIVALLQSLQMTLGLSLLFVSHDLAVVELIADKIAVMYLGRIVETFDKRDLWSARHPYTRLLLASVPRAAPRSQAARYAAAGQPAPVIEPPDPFAVIPGCAFYARCANAQARCRTVRPETRPIHRTHSIACHFPTEIGNPLSEPGRPAENPLP